MIRSLMLAILTLFLALPALAAPLCHASREQPKPAETGSVHAHGHGTTDQRDDHEKQQHEGSQHGCLGCAAPQSAHYDSQAPEPFPFIAGAPTITDMTGLAHAPIPPPPRK